MSRNVPSSGDNIIDARDVQKRIDDLESELEALEEAVEDAKEAHEEAKEKLEEWRKENDQSAVISDEELAESEARSEIGRAEEAVNEWKASDEGEELKTLKELISECGSDATLILDSHFEDYARQYADDIGATDGNEGWPFTCIDWEQAARDLQMDYSSVEFDGATYHYR